MKAIFTFFSSLMITTAALASDGRNSASLTVKAGSKSDIVVVVDGTRYDLGLNSVMISDLDACTHDVTVYQEKETDVTNCAQKSYDVVFKSKIDLKPRTNLEIAVDACGIITMNETKFRSPSFGSTWPLNNASKSYAASSSSPDVISNDEFGRVIWAIGRESAETNRMKSASQIISENNFTVEQVRQITDLFCIEGNKLAIAKLAYGKTVNQSSYYALNDIFHSASSRDELSNCIRK